MKYPFIYIAAMPRTGSTVISEALTQWPDAFVFIEPDLGKNTFHLRKGVNDPLFPLGVDLDRFFKYRKIIAFFFRRLRRFGFPQDYLIKEFKYNLLPKLGGDAVQFGVKEVHNLGWQNYHRHFPHMKVLIIGRDPRDIYVSLYYSQKHGMFNKQSLVPEVFAEEQNSEFYIQRIIATRVEHLNIRYEDLCGDSVYLKKIKAFVQSPLRSEEVFVGQFVGKNPQRIGEHLMHGNKITTNSIQRWQREKDSKLVAQAQRVFDLMPEYTGYWGYNK